MAKIEQGRLDGVYGMRKFGAAELYAMANGYEALIRDPKNKDDPKWLQRRADRIRKLADQKAGAFRRKVIDSELPRNVKARVRAGL
jgi:hypothetical protein